MKRLLIFLFTITIALISCDKKEGDCTPVTITQIGNPGTLCSHWAIKVGSTTYPSANIPAEFQVEGKMVCADYDLYDDLRLCACCGGTWANIKSMRNFTR